MSEKSSAIARFKTAFQLRLPRTYEFMKSQRPATRKRKKSLTARTAADVFSEIYDSNSWLSDESKSGGGSTLAATAELRAELPHLISDLNIKTLIDAPCGDFNWMSRTDLQLQRYIGGDVVPALVEHLNGKYGNEVREFVVIDLTQDELPEADALFCRDLFLHLSFADIDRIMGNFLRSRCSYLVASTYPDVKVHFDIATGDVRRNNMLRPPFNWPRPIRQLSDNADELMDRRMGVWHRDQF